MKEKSKSTTKAKVLTVVLVVLFLGSCAALVFAVCTDILGLNKAPTEPVTTIATEPATEAVTTVNTEATVPTSSVAPTETTSVSYSSLTLGSTYDVEYWAEYKAENGSAGLGVLFGAHTQSAEVNFSEDNKFSVVIIANNEPIEVSSGTYSFVSDSEIELRYENSNIETAIVSENDNGVVTVMDFSMDVDDTTLRISLAD